MATTKNAAPKASSKTTRGAPADAVASLVAATVAAAMTDLGAKLQESIHTSVSAALAERDEKAQDAQLERVLLGGGARNVPPVTRKYGGIDTRELKCGQDHPRDMRTDGEAHLDPAYIEPVREIDWREKAAALEFNEEQIEIRVMDSADPNAEYIIYTSVNGVRQYFLRNQDMVVKRKFAEALARSKSTRYSQQHYRDANGDNAIRNVPHTSPGFPFQVIRDPNPKGQAWIRGLMAEA